MKILENKAKKKEKNYQLKKKLKRYVSFILGCLLVAISYNAFLANHDLVPGGISGLAIILNHLIGINNALFVLLVGIVLLVISYFLLGKEKTKYSVLGTVLFPIFLELTLWVTKIVTIDESQ